MLLVESQQRPSNDEDVKWKENESFFALYSCGTQPKMKADEEEERVSRVLKLDRARKSEREM